MRDDIIERLESTREIIAAELARISKIDMTIAPPYARASVRTAALHIERALHDAGYRLVAPGELDAETLERAAQVAESTPAYGDPVEIGVGLGPVGERIASAIRALKSKDR
mgnify:CR=1 FL=1